MTKEKRRESFLEIFPNIPLPERRNPIYVHKTYGPMSWNVVWLEVKADSLISQEALEFLESIDML